MLTALFASCLDDDTQYTYSDDASITAFSIGSIKTVWIEGNDTTTFTVDGSQYAFRIDQLKGTISNPDSLPYHTDVTHVLASIAGGATSIRYNRTGSAGQDSVCVWQSADSLDFSRPLTLTTYAENGMATRLYEVRLNVHLTDPDSLIWNRIDGANYPADQMGQAIKAVRLDGRTYVFGQTDTQTRMTCSTDARTWTEAKELDGPAGAIDLGSVRTAFGRLLILAGNELYTSTDGLNWQATGLQAETLIAPTLQGMQAISQGKGKTLVCQNDILTWDDMADWAIPDNLPTQGLQTVLMPSGKTLLAGDEPTLTDSTTIWVFTPYSAWMPYVTERSLYNCPRLENLTLTEQQGVLYAFGGKGRQGTDDRVAFDGFFRSENEGLVWKPVERGMAFPDELKGTDISFATVTDEEHNLWIIPADGHAIWKGRLNRWAYKQQ